MPLKPFLDHVIGCDKGAKLFCIAAFIRVQFVHPLTCFLLHLTVEVR